MSILSRFSIALLGGVAMGLTVAPVSWWPLAWIALVPLWYLLLIEEKSLKKLLLYALIWGFCYHGFALFWITGIHPMTWMGVPWLASLAIALFCWLFITLWGAAIAITWAFLMFHVRRTFPRLSPLDALARILLGTALWCALESLWSQSPLWWTTIAYTQSPHNLPILQWGSISGFTTITAIIMALNASMAESIFLLRYSSRNFIFFLLPVSLCLGSHLWGLNAYHKPIEKSSTDAIKIGIIQGNIPNTLKLYPEGFRRAIEGYTSGYKILADRGVDAVLTPETALPYYWDDLAGDSSLYRAIITKKIPIWVGAFGRDEKGYTNSLFTVDGQGKTLSRFDKVILVPLGEYVPFEEILGKIIDRLSPLKTRLIPGNPGQVIETPFGRASVGICYESAYSEHFRLQTAMGGEFILTASNNAHYSPAMPAQHHAQDVMRAIESDRWMARATNTGYSAFVDPRGNTLWISGINTYELHAETIYRRQTKTLYTRWGNWFTKVLVIFGLILWIGRIRQRRLG
jgi:apolipoprotein N-acyltransferase